MLSTRALTVAYGTEPILHEVTLDFRPGEVTGLVGPNGAGKSTLLRALFGLHPAFGGTLALDGDTYCAGARRRWQARLGFMPQDTGSRAGLTALEIVLLGALDRLSLRVGDTLLHRATEGLDNLGILGLANRRIETLSGGQRQLVFFAQTLMREPRALLLDEPVSALDVRHQLLLLGCVAQETRDRGLVTVVVLHDLNLAAGAADRLVLLDRGRVRADGVPIQVLTPTLLAEVYSVRAKLHNDPDGRPWVHVREAVMPEESSGGFKERLHTYAMPSSDHREP